MKIILIEHEPFSLRKNGFYYIDQFIGSQNELTYWDVSKALRYSKHVKYNESLESPYVRKIHNFEEIIASIAQIEAENTVLILELYFNKETLRIFEAIRKKGIKWVRINYYHNPTMYLNVPDSFYDKLLKMFDFRRVVNKLNNIALMRRKSLSIPDIVFLTGSEKEVDAKKVVSLNFFDVEEYNGSILNAGESIKEEPYVVFLDIMFPHHPDFQRNGISTISAEIYFQKMRYFFDKLEKELQKTVVIACHPRSDYKGEYGNRLTIKNKTCELVKGADLVLTHGSLSISYALLAKKPILYLYFDEMLKTPDMRFYYNRMEKAQTELGTKMINIDSRDLVFDIPAVNKEKYEEFLSKVYLKNTDDLRSNFEIIQENLLQLLKR